METEKLQKIDMSMSPSRLSGHPRPAKLAVGRSSDRFNPDLVLSHVVILDHEAVKIESRSGSLALGCSR